MFTQSYERGRPLTDLKISVLPSAEATQTGTQVEFVYDGTVFAKG